MDYKSKYLKYKTKYNSLKVQLGGEHKLTVCNEYNRKDKSYRSFELTRDQLINLIDKIISLNTNDLFIDLLKKKIYTLVIYSLH
jgi:hypothetical protein